MTLSNCDKKISSIFISRCYKTFFIYSKESKKHRPSWILLSPNWLFIKMRLLQPSLNANWKYCTLLIEQFWKFSGKLITLTYQLSIILENKSWHLLLFPKVCKKVDKISTSNNHWQISFDKWCWNYSRGTMDEKRGFGRLISSWNGKW